jgi:S-formylglutathione hydrolase FrmB
MERVTRRRFLVGGVAAGAVTVGAVGFEATRDVHGTRRLLHQHGLLDGPNQTPPPTTVAPSLEFGTLDAPSGPVNYGLYLPAAPTTVLYCLHGRGGNRHDAFDGMAMNRFVADRNLPWAIASLDGGEGYWHRRRDGSDGQRDLVDVLMPFVTTKAPGVKSAIIGWSMGGYGALLIPLRHPGLFSAAVANSPAMWTSFSRSAPGAFDDAADFRANDVMASASTLGDSVRVDCGDDDPFAEAVRRLDRAAPQVDVHLAPGFHEDATWRSFLPAQLDFIQRHVT